MSTIASTKDRSQAIFITVGVHVAVILLFLLIKYTIPAQIQREEYGMEVNLGNSEDGFGDDQPEDPNPPSNQIAAGGSTAQGTEDDDIRDVHTDENLSDDDVAIKKPDVVNKTAKKIQTEDKTKNKNQSNNNISTSNSRQQTTSRFNVSDALNSASNGNAAANTKAGGSQGDGQGTGDKGKPGGDPNSKNYTGSGGKGTAGIDHNFNNRKIVVWPNNKAEFAKGGTVKVQVRVDKAGNVSVLGTSGSTDPSLNALARQKAAQIKFNKASAQDPIEQKGTIIFNFKVGK